MYHYIGGYLYSIPPLQLFIVWDHLLFIIEDVYFLTDIKGGT